MPRVHTSELDAFAKLVDDNGMNVHADAVRERYHPFALAFDTRIDAGLSPFSAGYFAQQVALYQENSGRELDQETGELHGDDLGPLLRAPNPTGIPDAGIVAEHVRCTSTMMSLACLGRTPTVLDLGAGHGLGSEVFAYAGCSVHAVDIDPGLGGLARRRADRLGLDITRSDMNFDDVGDLADGRYDAAFFFQSLHHCLRPWELIAALAGKLKPSGVIGFVGEPVQDEWNDWGVRLDPEAVYVARRRGWFECGWSPRFIRECFERSGFELSFFSGGHLGGQIGVAARGGDAMNAIISKARSMGLGEIYGPGTVWVRDERFASAIGAPATLLGRPAFEQVREGRSALIHGPYASLEPGLYEAAVIATRTGSFKDARRAALTLDVATDGGGSILSRHRVSGVVPRANRVIVRRFAIPSRARDVEVRVFVSGGRWTVSVPAIRRIG